MQEQQQNTTEETEEVFRSVSATLPPFPDKNEPSASIALSALGVSLRYNLRTQHAELNQSSAATIEGAPVQEWLQLTDRMESRLRDLIARRFTYQTSREVKPMVYAKERWKMVIEAHLCSRERDPFLDWLRERPEWDCHRRLDTYLDDLFSAGDSPLVRWVAQFLFLGPVHRAYAPGAKLDEMPVLVGAQGIGKSALLLNLFPPEHSVWMNDGLHLAADPKVRAEALQGRVLVEVSEMAGSTRADLESLKDFVSKQDDGSIRLAFRRNPEPAPRRCIIVGTTNRQDSLPNDPSGNRRFIPITLKPATQAVEDYLAEHRDQLWAEALYRHSQGISPRLPRDLTPHAAVAAEAHRNRDTIIEDKLDSLPPNWEGTLEETARKIELLALEDSGAKLPMREMKRLSTAMTGQGYSVRQVKREGVKKRLWKREAVPGTG